MAEQNCQYCGGVVVEAVCEDCGRPAGKVSLLATSGADAAMGEGAPSTVTAGSTVNTAKTGHSSTRFTVNYPTRQKAVGDTGKTSRRQSGRTTHTSTRRAALGGGLISLPDMPSQDPLKLLMAVPEVPESKRRCPACDAKVSRTKGFCPACGAQYDFEPHLKAGDVVSGKYEVKGPVAFGGLGWIYLGWDTVLSRWVVLKGLLNAKDEASASAAVAERQFLAAVKHAKIVGIYDFVNHAGEGYIIMEYVGGVTIHSLRKQRGPLPVEEAIAYILGVLPAFAYLHAQGMVYCDFKPDNLMLEGGDVKLIDMGAVRKIGDPNGDIFGTVGYMAPEADDDPRAVSDLYTIGRTLATLIMEFKFATDFERSLPHPDTQPALAENESLYRFLLRATHPDADERFQTADEMADQLFGVLREIVALKSEPKPADSKVFSGDNLLQHDTRVFLQSPTPHTLPAMRMNLDDRGTAETLRALAVANVTTRVRELQRVVERFGTRAVEPRLRLIETLIHHPDTLQAAGAEIEKQLQACEQADAFDWRPHWLRGVLLLKTGKGREAMACFERVYFEMPGEIAPRLAMGFAAEVAGLPEQAIAYYDRVGRVDPGYITANFGLARCYAMLKQVDQAVLALGRVPATHTLRNVAMLGVAELVLSREQKVDKGLLQAAESALRAALADGGPAHQIAGRLLTMVVQLTSNKPFDWGKDTPFLGQPFAEKPLRLAAEAHFRQAAKLAEEKQERLYWITLANRVRPVSLI